MWFRSILIINILYFFFVNVFFCLFFILFSYEFLGLGHEHFWTSGTDLADEGNFFWMSTGRPITFTNWNAGEPNNFRYENGEEENCLELWNRDGKGLKWNDSPCSFETYFVCEVQPNWLLMKSKQMFRITNYTKFKKKDNIRKITEKWNNKLFANSSIIY